MERYRVVRIEEQMYGCEELPEGAEVCCDVTVDYQQIIEKQEFNGLELCTGLPQFPVLKQEEKGGK